MQLREAQSLSLATAVKGGEEWTLAEIQLLTSLRADNTTYFEIAQALNRSVYAVSTMARVMGIARQRAQKPAPKIVACDKCWLVHPFECQ